MFSDQHHIEKIREGLYKGNVSVMVGSGFSLNATQLSKSKGTFLTWQNLVQGLKNKLYLDKEGDGFQEADPLKLAVEYEFEFGRQALDEFLKESLPDENYVPGELHKMLLLIPWADIFTTNYDTLIERTREFTYEKHYSLVQTVADIPNSIKPRIVKLHGSFPSQRPFIFTEEDYRTYPKRFTPFVNLVQQSIVENTLCLIGFSGDDANFKNWIGWVKDNLGSYASSIYFCGYLRESQKRNLESNNIKVIDFSELFSYSRVRNNHEYSLKWFFLELLKPQSQIPYYWPEVNQENPLDDWEVPVEVKEKLSYRDNNQNGYRYSNIRDLFSERKLNSESTELLVKKWQEERSWYPQWVIAPRNARNHIWHETELGIVPYLTKLKEKIPVREYITVLYEFIWRLETGLLSLSIPRFKPLISTIEGMVNSFIESIDNDAHIKIKFGLQVDEVHMMKQRLVQIGFTLLNYYRENFKVEEIDHILSHYSKIGFEDAEQLAEYYYQQCLFTLSRFNYSKTNKLLDEWTENYNIPYWEVRRASIFIELRKYNEAEKVLLNALNDIRKRNVEGNDIELLSQESWILKILNVLKNRPGHTNLFNSIEREEFVKVLNCDANRIYEEVVTGVDNNLIKQQDKQNVSFDPGIEIKNMTFGNRSDRNFRNVIQIFKMIEKTGLRHRIRNTVFDKDRVLIASEHISHENNLRLAINNLIELGNKKYLQGLLVRETIAIADEETVNSLFMDIWESVKQLHSLKQNNQLDLPEDPRFKLLIEVLSRLTIRLNKDQLQDCFQLAVEIYLSSNEEKYIHLFGKELSNLFKRILFAFEKESVRKNLKCILELPLSKGDFVTDPIHFVDLKYVETEMVTISDSVIDSFINQLDHLNGNLKTDVLMRISVVSELGLLSVEQKNKVGEILEEDDFGDTDFYFEFIASNFLLDSKFKSSVIKKIKQFLEQNFVQIFGKPNVRSLPSPEERQFNELRNLLKQENSCINFSFFKDSICVLVENLNKWWNQNKSSLIKNIGMMEDLSPFPWIQYKRFLSTLLYTVSYDNSLKAKVYDIAKDILEVDEIPSSSILPMAVYTGFKSSEAAEKLIKYNLNSGEENKVFDSLEGILNWIDLIEQKLIDSIPSQAIDDLIQKVFLRQSPYLDQSLNALIHLIRAGSLSLTADKTEKLIDSLSNLYIETDLFKHAADSNYGTLIKEEFLPIRALTCELAHELYIRFKNEKLEIPQSLIIWKEESEKGIVPEIRKAWRDAN
ncbi:SIR2-like domain-containing protein [Lentibacillus persicus]|uniref:SIR2-like domain-containing protein n=1 Tax=Lentibacillus persicus TaxID=640948 RepID=A0A1I1VX24_9BACI|nr:SIR2 family protein [Lentibacillus persicus]SFD87454.1 SIR2-like domain-containing protein [Lentibacillus persicus]